MASHKTNGPPAASYVTINIPICAIPDSTSCLPLPITGLFPAAAAGGKTSSASVDSINPVTIGVRGNGTTVCQLTRDEGQIITGELSDPEFSRKIKHVASAECTTEDKKAMDEKLEGYWTQMDKVVVEIYQLVGLFSLFVGVVLTAALQSSSVQCQHIWSPVILCVIALLIIVLVTTKLSEKYQLLVKDIKSEEEKLPEDSRRFTNLLGSPYESCGIKVTESRLLPFVLTVLTLIIVGSFIHILCLTPRL